MPQININWVYTFDQYYETRQLNMGRPWSGNNYFSLPTYFRNEVIDKVLDALRSAAPVDTGLLQGSMWSWVSDYFPNGIIGIVGPGVRYAGAVNAGSHPHMPPLLYLPGWALRNWPGLGPDTVVRAGRTLQKHIATYGTRPQPFMEAAVSVAQSISPTYGGLIVTYEK